MGLEKSNKINLKPKLTFESAKCLLYELDLNFKSLIDQNLSLISKIRQARNESYLEHGIKNIDKEIAKNCLKLIEIFFNFISTENQKIIENAVDLFELIIEFIKSEFF